MRMSGPIWQLEEMQIGLAFVLGGRGFSLGTGRFGDPLLHISQLGVRNSGPQEAPKNPSARGVSHGGPTEPALSHPPPTPPETVRRGYEFVWRFSTLRLTARSKSASWGYSVLSGRIGQGAVATSVKARSSLMPVHAGPKSRSHYFCSIRGFSRLSRSTLSFSTSEVGSTGFSSGFETLGFPAWS